MREEYKVIINKREFIGFIIDRFDNGCVLLRCKEIDLLVREEDLKLVEKRGE